MKLTITKTPFLYIAWAFVILSMFLSGFMEVSRTDYSITIWFKSHVVQHDVLLAPVSKLIWVENMSKSELNKSFENYLDERKDNSDRWMTWMSILSTIFAVFFVYSSFKVDKDLREMHEKWFDFLEKLEKRYNEKIKEFEGKVEMEKEELNKKNEEEKEELKNELAFIREISFVEKQINELGEFDESINKLNELLKDEKNTSDSERYNRIVLLVSKAHLWKWGKNKDITDLSQAIEFAKEAIIDVSDPYFVNLIDLFNENWKSWENS